MNITRKRTSTLTAALAALAFGGTAAADSFETTTLATAVPAERNGSLTVRACSTCPPRLVRIDASSRFLIGDSEVDHAQFVRFIASGGDRYLNVSYNPRTGLVKKLHVPGTFSARPERGAR